MVEHTLDDVVLIAERAHSAGKKWHFHILAPSCCFNPHKDSYGLMVEIPLESLTVTAFVAQRPVEQGKKLVSLLHGSQALRGTGCSAEIENEVTSQILERARCCNALKIPWHHHMLFPDCALNSSPGKWNLIFEDPASGEILNALYDAEPLNDLKEVEALFYAQER
jgi:hypothetical protein